jgi:hypothetical protein
VELFWALGGPETKLILLFFLEFRLNFKDEMGFYSMLQKMIDEYLAPFTEILFPEDHGEMLDDHHGFLVSLILFFHLHFFHSPSALLFVLIFSSSPPLLPHGSSGASFSFHILTETQVRYKAGEDVKLSLHVDDSEVTLNVCLGKDFEGT